MKNEVFFEWSLEEIDENGDVQNVIFEDRLINLPVRNCYALALIRRTGNDIDGELDRVYAYVNDYKLPEYFEESDLKVPKRYHKELQEYCIKNL